MPIVIVVVSILVSLTIMSVILVLVCARQRRSMKPDGERADYTQRSKRISFYYPRPVTFCLHVLPYSLIILLRL